MQTVTIKEMRFKIKEYNKLQLKTYHYICFPNHRNNNFISCFVQVLKFISSYNM